MRLRQTMTMRAWPCLALEEGDAVLSMFQWAIRNLTPEELAGIGATPVPDTSGVPQWMVRQLEFPYLTGAKWVSAALGVGWLGGGGRCVRDPAGLHRAGPASGEVPDQ